MCCDDLSGRRKRENTAGKHVVLNLDSTDTDQKYMLEMGNSVLNHTEGKQAKNPDATLSLTRETLNNIMLKQTTLQDALSKGDVKLSGDQSKLNEVFGSLDD